MIRLRSPNNTVAEISEDISPFVELCDSDGNIAALFYIRGPKVKKITKGSEEAKRYEKLYGVSFCDIINNGS